MYCSQMAAVRFCATTQSSVLQSLYRRSLSTSHRFHRFSRRPHFLLRLIPLIPSAHGRLPLSSSLPPCVYPQIISHRITCTYSRRPAKMLSCNGLFYCSRNLSACRLVMTQLTGRRELSIQFSQHTILWSLPSSYMRDWPWTGCLVQFAIDVMPVGSFYLGVALMYPSFPFQ
jgi:hypothetical protein